MTLSSKLQKELKGLPPHFIVLVETPAATYHAVYVELIKLMLKKGKSSKGICVTMTRIADSLQESFIAGKIDTGRIHYVDCVSRLAGSTVELPNANYVSHPRNLTDLSIAITKSVQKLGPGDKFLALDSLSSLLIYNNEKTVLQFMNFLTNKMRTLKINGAVIAIEKELHGSFGANISQFCDKVINLEK